MLIKKLVYCLILSFFLLFTSVHSQALDVSAESAVVIVADTKEVIFEKNAFVKRSMASTTKMMTSILAIESGRMGEKVTVASSALTEGSSAGLKEGDVLTLESLVYAMMLESGNDAANACALFLGNSFEEFSFLMNEKSKQIKMQRTNFITPSGLDDENHYSTAYDMALLGAYCIKNPEFRNICSIKSKKVDFIKPDITVTFFNHNKLLENCEGVFGIKTGFTKKSGRCLVSACERDGATLVCVTLNAGDDWNDHRKLYDMSFAELNKSTMHFSDFADMPVYGGNTQKLKIYCDDFVVNYMDDRKITRQVFLPKIVYAPINKNEVLGRVVYYIDNSYVHTSYIYADDNVSSAEETYKNTTDFFSGIKKFLTERIFNYDRR